MARFEHFDLNEGRLAQVVKSSRDMILKKITTLDQKRRERNDLLHRISTEEDSTAKKWMENDAKMLNADIQTLLGEVGHFEHGR